MIKRIHNALRCMAVSDAVGTPFEFSEMPNPLSVLHFAQNEVLRISDDTQMTLFGFDAVNKAYDGYSVSFAFEYSYLDWYHTQTSTKRDVGLLQFDELFQQVAPGMTCMDSLESLHDGLPVENDSMGCGSVMRILPCVLFLEHGTDLAITWAKQTADITHKHPENAIAVELLMRAYDSILNDQPVEPIIASTISELGKGWTALECVRMAIWAYQNARDFDELLVMSICHSGDSDSVAAIAGSLWGLSNKEFSYYENIFEKRPIEYTVSRMISFKQYLAEAKQVGILYHFTTPAYFDMLSSAEHQKTTLGVGTPFVLYGSRGVSFTRNYGLAGKTGDVSLTTGYSVRLTIDGDKLSNKYKITPMSGLTYNAETPADVLNPSIHNRVKRSAGEAEELVIHSSNLVDVSGCILQVDFVNRPYPGYPLEWYDGAAEITRLAGYPTHVGKSFNQYRK